MRTTLILPTIFVSLIAMVLARPQAVAQPSCTDNDKIYCGEVFEVCQVVSSVRGPSLQCSILTFVAALGRQWRLLLMLHVEAERRKYSFLNCRDKGG